MTKIKLNLKGNYKTVQEGERVLEITDAKFTPSGAPEKFVLNMKDVEDGATLVNSYNMKSETGLWLMGLTISMALGLEDGDDFDTKDVDKLKGIRLLCEVAHSEYNDKTYANVKRVIEKVESNMSEEELSNSLTEVENVLYNRSDIDDSDEDLD